MITSEGDAGGHRKLIYATAFDVTAPNGPGVNEREFLLACFGEDVLDSAFVPKPHWSLTDLEGQSRLCFLSPSAPGPLGLMVINQIGMMRLVDKRIKDAKARGVAPVVVVRMPWLPWSILRLQKMHPETPFFMKSVGIVHQLPEYRGMKQLFSRALLPLHEKLVGEVLRRARGLDAPTPQIATFLSERFNLPSGAVACIPNATNTTRFDPACLGEPKGSSFRYIGYVGGHPYLRGGREILRALASLRARYPDLRGLIVGGDQDKLLGEAQALGVSDICEIPGKVPYDQVREYFARLDLLIASDVKERAGTFGNSNQKIRQALAMRVPVITNPNCEQLLLDEGVVRGIDTTDAEAVEREIVRLLEMPRATLMNLKDHCRRVAVEHYSTAATLRQRMAFWNSRIAASKLAQ